MKASIQTLNILNAIQAKIELPVVFFKSLRVGFRICWHNGNKYRYLVIADKFEAATFLKQHGHIDGYIIVGNEVKLYRKTLFPTDNNGGGLIRNTTIRWDDISLTREDVRKIAVATEYQKANNTKPEARVISMLNNLRAA